MTKAGLSKNSGNNTLSELEARTTGTVHRNGKKPDKQFTTQPFESVM